ncbi:MAG: hypothetical protein JW741_17330 [Sedimentisphaerales bacterium]|nr:hypothetical protein [Sedimentisphaerales bacterium]
MAEIALKVGAGGTYEDGDVLCAFNRRRILLCHAEMICWPRIDGRKVGGQLGKTQPLLEKLYQRTAQYKWERVSETEIKRTNLWTGSEIVYGSEKVEDPDRPKHMIHCRVKLYFALRNRSGKLPLFGSAGKEIAYGGNSKRDAATVGLLWDDIEAGTPLRRVNHERWPAGVQDLKSHLILAVDEFGDAEAESLVAPLLDEKSLEEEKPVLKKRSHRVDWRAALSAAGGLSASEADVLDKTRSVDVRGERTFERAGIILTKAK